ncbi:tRNA-aminoacylation cofactor arc1 isoform X1 [Phalaenopsis equestris]|uniref:tRNA-aminoacylation cofactor arc1 isoform X1 n=1 Tax=Phalaenopsis equestris TaxID=78828 RepID=UPI0009E3AD6B|nr:tRNA-aminoacylation cofactor arc1 isoform X1 [Phalaenopsis equestris]
MALDMEATSLGEFTSRRNRAIIYALCKRLSLDPEKFSCKTSGPCDITNLVSNFFQSSAKDISLTNNQDEVLKWANFASNLPDQRDAYHTALKDLNEDLAQKSVLLGGLKPSVADVIVFSALHEFLSHISNEEVQKYPNVIRWMDYIQNKEDLGGAFDMICVNKLPFGHFCSVDTLDENQITKKMVQTTKCVEKSGGNTNLKKDLPEEKASAGDKALVDSNKVNKAAVVKAVIEPTKKSTGEKKKPTEKESSDKDTEFSIAILNLQVGLIRKAWKHPSADSLLVEEIDLGDGNQRQVVSGLAKYYSPDDLINRLVVLISNVKPGKLRDVMSSGLVLCASNQENSAVEPIIPPEGAKIGERVSFPGFEGKPEDVLNPKKKQLEKITPHLYTDDKGVATYKGIPFMTSAGPCTSSITNATIK